MNGQPQPIEGKKSRITERKVGGGLATEWDIPAKRGVGFLMIFGCIFAGIPLLIITGMVALLVLGDGEGTTDTGWMIAGGVVFAGVFVLIGMGVFLLGLRLRYTSFSVKVRNGGVKVTRKFLKKETSEKLESGGVHGVGLYSNSSTNGKPDYGLMVKARNGDDLKLSNGCEEGELRWLASEMSAALAQQGGLPTDEELGEAYFSSSDDEGVQNGGEGGRGRGRVKHFAQQGVTISLLGEGGVDDDFVIEKNGSVGGRMMVFGGLFGMLFSAVFIWIGFFAEDGSMLFGIVGSLIALGAFLVFILGLPRLGTSEKYTFQSDTIIKEKLRGGVSRSKTRYQKSGFNSLVVASSGSSNGSERYSVKLMSGGGAKPLKLFGWVDSDVSELVKHKVNGWLKEPQVLEVANQGSAERSYSSGYGGSMTVERTGEKMDDEKPAVTITPTVLPSDVPVYSSTFNLKDLKGGRWYVRIGLGLFCLVGLGMMFFGVLNVATAKASESWPSKQGVVLESKIDVSSSDDGATYGADVRYQFEVNGKSYEGDKVTVSEMSTSSRKRAAKIIARYPVGGKVAVFYDPEFPEDCVLETGLTGGSWLLPGIGLPFFIVPFVMWIILERSLRKDARKKRNSVEAMQGRYGKVG